MYLFMYGCNRSDTTRPQAPAITHKSKIFKKLPSFYLEIFSEIITFAKVLINTLTMETKNTMLPSRVKPYRRLLDAASGLRKDISRLASAVFELRTIAELPTQEVSSLEDFTHEWLEAHISPATNAIKADRGLTVPERNTRLKEWHTIQQKASKQISIINGVINKWRDMIWYYNPQDGTVGYSDEQFDKVVDDAATLDVPNQAATHWQMLQNIVNEIRILRAWEDEQDIAHFRINDAVDCSPSAFAERWATNEFSINHAFDKYRVNWNKKLFI